MAPLDFLIKIGLHFYNELESFCPPPHSLLSPWDEIIVPVFKWCNEILTNNNLTIYKLHLSLQFSDMVFFFYFSINASGPRIKLKLTPIETQINGTFFERGLFSEVSVNPQLCIILLNVNELIIGIILILLGCPNRQKSFTWNLLRSKWI